MEAYLIAIITIAVIVILAILVKVYVKLTTGIDNSDTSLIGKTAIVTGANTGIGFETALEFAKRGGRVILACRNETAAEKARVEIVNRTNNPNVIVKLIDLGSLKSVRNFAEDINRNEEKLHILVNNAGAGILGNNFTEDGLLIGMQVNYFSSFLLTHLLLDKLKQSGPSRIVNVASRLASYIIFNAENINTFPSGILADVRVYNKSKLCNVLFTVALAEKLKNTQVTTNCLHPGIIRTGLFRNMPSVITHTLLFFITLFYKSPKEGAQTSIYLALSQDVDNISGKYFEECEQRWFPWNANKNNAEALWQKTEVLLKLNK